MKHSPRISVKNDAVSTIRESHALFEHPLDPVIGHELPKIDAAGNGFAELVSDENPIPQDIPSGYMRKSKPLTQERSLRPLARPRGAKHNNQVGNASSVNPKIFAAQIERSLRLLFVRFEQRPGRGEIADGHAFRSHRSKKRSGVRVRGQPSE